MAFCNMVQVEILSLACFKVFIILFLFAPKIDFCEGATGTIVIYFTDSSSLYLSVSEVFLLQVESPGI